MRTIINKKLEALMTSGADLDKEYEMCNAGKAWSTGDFDLFPAGGGQISALIKGIRPIKDIIQNMAT